MWFRLYKKNERIHILDCLNIHPTKYHSNLNSTFWLNLGISIDTYRKLSTSV